MKSAPPRSDSRSPENRTSGANAATKTTTNETRKRLGKRSKSSSSSSPSPVGATASTRRKRRLSTAAATADASDDENATDSWRFRLTIAAVAIGVVLAYALIRTYAPALKSEEEACPNASEISIPWFIKSVAPKVLYGDGLPPHEIVKKIHSCASAYDRRHPNWTLLVFVSVYVGLQTFAIPGPLILSLLTGALKWPFIKAQLVISFCATTGATMCYLLSRFLDLGTYASRSDPIRFAKFRERIARENRKGNLLYFMLFIRLTPFFPNWFVNLVSPMLGVPLSTFWLATFVGLIPANSLHYFTGKQIAEMATSANPDTMKNTIIITLLATALLFVRKWADKDEDVDAPAATKSRAR